MLGKKSLVQRINEVVQVKRRGLDPALQGSSSVRQAGEGGRVGAKRRQEPGTGKRVKAIGGGKTAPVTQKDRKDIGQSRTGKAGGAVLPTQDKEKSAASYAEVQKQRRREEAKKRAAAKASGQTVEKPKAQTAKQTSKAADKLLGKKTAADKPKPHPDYKPAKPTGYSRPEQVKLRRAGEKKLKGIMSDQERDKAKKKGETVGPQEIKRRVNKRMAN